MIACDVGESLKAERPRIVFINAPGTKEHVRYGRDNFRIVSKGQASPFLGDAAGAQIRIPREAAVERMEVLVGGACAVVLQVAPVEVMIVNKSPVKKQPAMRRERASHNVGGISVRPAVGRWPGATL